MITRHSGIESDSGYEGSLMDAIAEKDNMVEKLPSKEIIDKCQIIGKNNPKSDLIYWSKEHNMYLPANNVTAKDIDNEVARIKEQSDSINKKRENMEYGR